MSSSEASTQGRGLVTRGRDLITDRVGLTIVVLVATGLFVDLINQLATGTVAVSSIVGYLWNGTVIGLVIGLAGIGLSLTYSILGFANFSHGDLLTTGAFSGWTASFVVAGIGTAGLGELLLLNASPRSVGITVVSAPLAVLVGLLVAIAMTIAIAVAVDRLAYRPMRDAGSIALLIASIGVALVLRYLIVFVYSSDINGVTAGDVPTATLSVVDGAIAIDAHEATLVVAAIALMVGIHLLLQRTKLGKAMRAMADNKDLARITGIPTERVVLWTWIIGAGMAGAAGYLYVLQRGSFTHNIGWTLLLLIFAAVIVGGIGSIYGAIVGGIAIGVGERLALVWLPSDLTQAAAFGLMILILLFRPDGIFGGVKTA
jgi:branched-chain amino acid transport system permease protein